jgi:hypothetical protein
MDELTVTTVAKGLSKLMRLWQDKWQIICLFNSKIDLNRFRAEIPCAVYELPWLSPETDQKKRPDTKMIKDKSRLSWDIQKIHHLIEPLETSRF